MASFRGPRRDAPLRLTDGSSVCIIGGGPAGSFAAIQLLDMAHKDGISLDVMLFERRTDADKCGHATCKGCAGIISSRALSGMHEAGIELPAEMVLEEVDAYALHIPHSQREVASFRSPGTGQRIVSVYRGQGPRRHTRATVGSFDRYLRQEACRRGARLVHSCVRTVEWDNGPVVVTDEGPLEPDLLVLANGVNSRVELSPHFGYQPPPTAVMLQEECPRPANMPHGYVGAFFNQPHDVFFGTVVPKGQYVNVSVLGRNWTTIRRHALAEFLQSPVGRMDEFFPEPPANLCGCLSRIVVGEAKHYYGDRWVAVGDAAVSRLFKDGIGSALLTSRRAMDTALHAGVSARDFRKGYAPLCRSIALNNLVGRTLFGACGWCLERRLLSAATMRCIRREQQGDRPTGPFSYIIWGMLTGEYTYLSVLRKMLSPVTIGRFLAACAAEITSRPAPPQPSPSH